MRYLPRTQGLLLIHNLSAEWTEATVHEWLAQDHDANYQSQESNPGVALASLLIEAMANHLNKQQGRHYTLWQQFKQLFFLLFHYFFILITNRGYLSGLQNQQCCSGLKFCAFSRPNETVNLMLMQKDILGERYSALPVLQNS